MLAADSFVFARPLPDMPDGESVIAGYPWFGDWGRDTMIALPGLTLATGRHDSARRILETFARFVDRGMLPNLSSRRAARRAEYNTVDAALWYIEAWRAYVEATRRPRRLGPASARCSSRSSTGTGDGTRYGIGMDPGDGLLRAGEPGVQLTWMDAKVGDWVVTPRIGKPVEINALWYNALGCHGGLRRACSDAIPTPYVELADAGGERAFGAICCPPAMGCSTCSTVPRATMPACAPTRSSRSACRTALGVAAEQRRVVADCAPRTA